jgi:hypothetical protein
MSSTALGMKRSEAARSLSEKKSASITPMILGEPCSTITDLTFFLLTAEIRKFPVAGLFHRPAPPVSSICDM